MSRVWVIVRGQYARAAGGGVCGGIGMRLGCGTEMGTAQHWAIATTVFGGMVFWSEIKRGMQTNGPPLAVRTERQPIRQPIRIKKCS